jgi:hypothetical protein
VWLKTISFSKKPERVARSPGTQGHRSDESRSRDKGSAA